MAAFRLPFLFGRKSQGTLGVASATTNQLSPSIVLAIRLAFSSVFAGLGVFLALQTDHAGIKGKPVDPWNLVPSLLLATTFALLGKRFSNRVIAVGLGGLGGALGIVDRLAGPYGVVVGIVTGLLVVTLPVFERPRTARRPLDCDIGNAALRE